MNLTMYVYIPSSTCMVLNLTNYFEYGLMVGFHSAEYVFDYAYAYE